MRFISKIKKKKFNERINFDKILQLWFNYHFFFFQSLIFRGLKLRAFSLFIAIKAGLKMQSFLEIPLSLSTFVNENKLNVEEEVMDKNLVTLKIVDNEFFYNIFSYDSFVNKFFLHNGIFFKESSFSFLWFYFQTFFIKNMHNFFFFAIFKKFFFFKKLFFFSNPDFFFFNFLKFFFVIWFYTTKTYMKNFQLKIFKNFYFVKNNFKAFFFFFNYVNFFLFAFSKFFFKNFIFFKKFYFFNQIFLFFSEEKWRVGKQENSLVNLGIFRRFKYWHSFYSFFLIQWLYNVNKLQIELFQQDAFLKDKTVFDPSFVFFLALLKLTPILVLKPLPLGSVNYDMPFPLNYWRRISFASRWIINLLKKKSRVISVEGVVSSIIGTLFDEGFSIEKKNEVYSLVTLNRHLIRHKIMRR